LVIQVFSPSRIQGLHAAGVRAKIGLGQPEAADRFAGGQPGQPALLLLLGTVSVQGIHHQRALHAHKRAKSGVGPFELLHHEAVLHIRHARAAVTGQIGAEKSHPAQLRYQIERETTLAVGILDAGRHPRFHKLPGRAANQQLVVA